MSRLRLLLLLFLPIFSCLDVVNIAFTPERDCKESSSLVNNTWSAAIVPQVGDPQFREAAFISPIHLLTTKEAVMYTTRNGKEKMKELNEIAVKQWADQHLDRPIERILIPVEYDENHQISFGDLAIVQLEMPITRADAFSPICPPDSSDVDPELNVNAFFVENAGVAKRLIPYNYSKGAKYITTNDNRTQEFLTAILTDNFDRVVGLTLNETTAVNVRYWEEFICEHTGICMKSNRMQNWQKNSATHYMENGEIFLASPCSHSTYVNLMKESTPFTRLNEEEARDLKHTCGRPGSDDDFSFIVTISAEKESYDQGVESSNCTGSLISPRHVITTADCILSLNERALKWGTTVYFTNGKELIPNESGSGRPIPRFLLSARTKVKTIVIPPIVKPESLPGKRSLTHNIALLELDEPIPADSYTKPICLSHSTDPVPDELTVKYFTEATNDNREVRYRQTREIFDEKGNKSLTVQWDYELIRAMTVPLNHYCRDCQYLELNYRSEISYGSPIVALVNGRWTLIAVSTSLYGYYNNAMRPSYFAAFICIHTATCEDGETFTKRTLMHFDITASDVPLSVLRSEMQFHKGGIGMTSFQQVIASHSTMATSKAHRLNRLSANEYATLREECGKLMTNSRGQEFIQFSVPVGVITPRMNWYTLERSRMVCSGAFISTRHVLTTRKCALSMMDALSKSLNVFYGVPGQHMYGFYRPRLEWHEEAKIRLVLIPDQDKSNIGGHFEMAILELEKDIVPGKHHTILCLLDYKNWEEELLGSMPTILQYLRDTDYSIHWYNLSDTSQLSGRDDSKTGQIVYTKVNNGHVVKSLDHGGPFYRKKRDSVRYYLEGLLTDSSDNSFTFLPANLMYRDICRLTGVCPQPNDRRVPNDEHVYFMNEYETNVKQEVLCQPQINY